jgi:hypothetical protein
MDLDSVAALIIIKATFHPPPLARSSLAVWVHGKARPWRHDPHLTITISSATVEIQQLTRTVLKGICLPELEKPKGRGGGEEQQ